MTRSGTAASRSTTNPSPHPAGQRRKRVGRTRRRDPPADHRRQHTAAEARDGRPWTSRPSCAGSRAPVIDAGLRDEVRQLVIARNDRRWPAAASRWTSRRRSNASCASSEPEPGTVGYSPDAMAAHATLRARRARHPPGDLLQPADRGPARRRRLARDGRRDLQHGGLRGRRLGPDLRRAGRRREPRATSCSRPSRSATTPAAPRSITDDGDDHEDELEEDDQEVGREDADARTRTTTSSRQA